MANRDVESIRSRAKFIATLRRVADALEKQKPVRIQVASKRFIVPIGAEMSVEHEVEGGEEELELQLKWKTDEGELEAPKRPARKSSKAARVKRR
jgi:amphi-Trp domain-containing protein